MDFNTLRNNFFKNTKKEAKRRRQPFPHPDPFEKNHTSNENYIEYKKKHSDKYTIILKSIKK